MEEVTVTISPNGASIKIEAHGFVGPACSNFIQPLANALGVTEEEGKKPEFYLNAGAGVRVGA